MRPKSLLSREKEIRKRKTVGMKSAKVSIDGDVGESLIAVLTVN